MFVVANKFEIVCTGAVKSYKPEQARQDVQPGYGAGDTHTARQASVGEDQGSSCTLGEQFCTLFRNFKLRNR